MFDSAADVAFYFAEDQDELGTGEAGQLGEVVDLESLLREQIILMLPLKPLCDENCKGLCPHCGANLNREKCTCKTDAVDSPFAQLAKLKI